MVKLLIAELGGTSASNVGLERSRAIKIGIEQNNFWAGQLDVIILKWLTITFVSGIRHWPYDLMV